MGRTQNDYRTGRQPKVRSLVAVDAHFRNSAGVMGKDKNHKHKTDRQRTRKNLRAGEWES